MEIVLTSPTTVKKIIRRRRKLGLDRKDEVWNGRYIIMPDPDNEHQRFVLKLVMIFQQVVSSSIQGDVFPGCNVTDREDNWTKNFRVPDVALFLKGNPAEDRQTHFLGGPDLAVEVVSAGDRSRRKRAFYESVGTKELLLIDRDPWELELFRLSEGKLVSVGRATVSSGERLASDVVPLTFRLIEGELRPVIEVVHTDGIQQWIC